MRVPVSNTDALTYLRWEAVLEAHGCDEAWHDANADAIQAALDAGGEDLQARIDALPWCVSSYNRPLFSLVEDVLIEAGLLPGPKQFYAFGDPRCLPLTPIGDSLEALLATHGKIDADVRYAGRPDGTQTGTLAEIVEAIRTAERADWQPQGIDREPRYWDDVLILGDTWWIAADGDSEWGTYWWAFTSVPTIPVAPPAGRAAFVLEDQATRDAAETQRHGDCAGA